MGISAKYTEAIDFYCLALAGRRRVLGDDDEDTKMTTTLMYQCCTLAARRTGEMYARKEWDAAIPIQRKVVEGFTLLYGADHKVTLVEQSNLALLLKSAGQLQASEEQHRAALRGFERTFGPNHKHTVMTCSYLSCTYKQLGRLTDALAMQRRVAAGMAALGHHDAAAKDAERVAELEALIAAGDELDAAAAAEQ